jgi:hypothetical protein
VSKGLGLTQSLATGVQTIWRVGRDLGVRKTELCLPPGQKPRKC